MRREHLRTRREDRGHGAVGQGRVKMGQCVGQPWPENREGSGPGEGPGEKCAWKGSAQGRARLNLAVGKRCGQQGGGRTCRMRARLGDPAPKGEGRAGA